MPINNHYHVKTFKTFSKYADLAVGTREGM